MKRTLKEYRLEIGRDAPCNTEADLQPWSGSEEGTLMAVSCEKHNGLQWVQETSRKMLFPRTTGL